MIEIFIFELHILAIVYAFVKNFQQNSIKEGFLAVIIILLIFSIGWALTSSLSHALYPDDWKSIYFNADSLALILLVIPESYFFYQYFLKE